MSKEHTKRKTWTPRAVSRVKTMYLDGMSLDEIGASQGRTRSAIGCLLRKRCGYDYLPVVADEKFFKMYPGGVVRPSKKPDTPNKKETKSSMPSVKKSNKRRTRKNVTKNQKEFTLLWGAVNVKW